MPWASIPAQLDNGTWMIRLSYGQGINDIEYCIDTHTCVPPIAACSCYNPLKPSIKLAAMCILRSNIAHYHHFNFITRFSYKKD
jgi:hypothetical protein